MTVAADVRDGRGTITLNADLNITPDGHFVAHTGATIKVGDVVVTWPGNVVGAICPPVMP